MFHNFILFLWRTHSSARVRFSLFGSQKCIPTTDNHLVRAEGSRWVRRLVNEFSRDPAFAVPILGQEWGEHTNQPANTDRSEPGPEHLPERDSLEQILDARKCVQTFVLRLNCSKSLLWNSSYGLLATSCIIISYVSFCRILYILYFRYMTDFIGFCIPYISIGFWFWFVTTPVDILFYILCRSRKISIFLMTWAFFACNY